MSTATSLPAATTGAAYSSDSEFPLLVTVAKTPKPSDEITAHVEPSTTAAKIIERFAQEFLQQVRAKAVTPSMDGAEHAADLELDGTTSKIGLQII